MASSPLATLAIVGTLLTVGTVMVATTGDSMQGKGASIARCLEAGGCAEDLRDPTTPRLADPATAARACGWSCSAGGFLYDVADGAVRGDFVRNPSWGQWIGNVGIGFTPVSTVAAARDMVADGRDIWQGIPGGWKNLGLTVLGLIPVAGAAKGVFRMYRAAQAAKVAKAL
jgi:hypothetical protein